ncbi:MAG: flavin-containing monooxygenase [Oceanococcus sp.]
MQTTDFDVIIIGAGLSGIGMACQLQLNCPNKRFAILERRKNVGETWDLFRYPGIRSDSDMFTFGFRFRPWVDDQVLADGGNIRQYVQDTAEEYQVYDKIQFGQRVETYSWSSQDKFWRVRSVNEDSGEERLLTSKFVVMCSGYYDYDQGYCPEFAGREDFKGPVIHPQHWPEGLDYSGKKVVVIGSGATAVTLVPAMSDKAAHVTMLQRSPTYIINLPAVDHISRVMKKFMPLSWVYAITRRRNIFLQRYQYKKSLKSPDGMREWLLKQVRKALKDSSNMQHFEPSYAPWDQRLCAVPDGDLFAAINSGKAAVVTDHIERFDETGIQLKSGEHLDADIIITATGLNVSLMHNMSAEVDGKTVVAGQGMSYKATLLQDIPNMGAVYGYTNAPWTLKADIASGYICRLLNYMDEHGHEVAVAHPNSGSQGEGSVMDTLNSGYVRRAAHTLPRQGKDLPWKVLNDYKVDKKMLLKQPINDGVLQFDPTPAT